MSTSKYLFNITEKYDKQFNIHIYKDENNIQYIIFVIENNTYRFLLPDAKKITLKEKLRDINAFPLFRMLIQFNFQELADSNQKNRFKNQDISKLTGKMWRSSKEFREEFKKYTSRVNLLRPKPQYDFKTQDPYQKPNRGKRSYKPYKKSGNDISIIQQLTGSSSELFTESIYNGTQWQNDKNNTVNHPKQGDNIDNAKLPANNNVATSNDITFNPLASLIFPDATSLEDCPMAEDFYYLIGTHNVAEQFNLVQYDNNSSTLNFYQDNSILPNNITPHSSFNIPVNLGTYGFRQDGHDFSNLYNSDQN
ncbi:9679_t:CDS:1 [Dentiscutata heterogama]|uniref:9679_t:CDS:1 n=1 Tax=Dentiscutata heterogama TaxID=1316150 RepID=A0ACA9LLH1_9GLOM|nr:9679_t:CDS:1 [Dentiscutata heterogama]